MKNSILLTTTIFLTSSYGINAQKPFNQQLREAAKNGNLTEVKKILEKPEIDINEKDNWGETVLIKANYITLDT